MVQMLVEEGAVVVGVEVAGIFSKSIKFQCIEKICKTLSFTFVIGIEYGEKGYIPQNSFQQGLTKRKKIKIKAFCYR